MPLLPSGQPVTCDAPAPPAIVQVVARATVFVSRFVLPVEMPEVCASSAIGPEAGATDGKTVFVSLTDHPATVRAVSPNLAATVLHETLHLIGWQAGTMDPDPVVRCVEEGMTEAVTHDLFPRFAYKWLHLTDRWSLPEVVYWGQVQWIRRVSAARTHSRWPSPAARRWRIQAYKVAPNLRPALDFGCPV